MESLDPKYFVQVHNQRHKELVEEAKGQRFLKKGKPQKIKSINLYSAINLLENLFSFRFHFRQ
jgi:hypothetical protein